MQQQQQAAQAQQMAELRDLEIQQQQQQMARANKEAADQEAWGRQVAAMFGGGGIQTASAVQPHGNYGAATGGSPQPAMFGSDPMLMAWAQKNPDAALQFALEQKFAQPKDNSTDDMREYQQAVSQGFDGSFLDYQLALKKAGANSTVSNINLKQYGDIPPGYRLVETPQGAQMELVPGSPAADAKTNRDEAAAMTTDIVTTDINRALEQMDNAVLPTTGFAGDLLSNLPNTAAHDVSKLVMTIKGNIGIDKLQAMRMQSPTGGALGNVTEGELATLQSTLGNLEQSQSDEQFRENLKRVYNTYLDIVHGKGMGGARYPIKAPKGPEASGGGELRYDNQGNLIGG
jgi:hypothetical protein